MKVLFCIIHQMRADTLEHSIAAGVQKCQVVEKEVLIVR
jgi:hypothetical protein